MMLTDFSPEVQKQVLEELTDGLKRSQEKSAIEKVCGLAEEVKLDYVPLTLRLPVVVHDFDDGMEKEDKVFGHAVAVGGDIEVFENRQDAYDHQAIFSAPVMNTPVSTTVLPLDWLRTVWQRISSVWLPSDN